MPREVEFDSRARAEVLAAYRWYENQSPLAAMTFVAEIEWAISMIANSPTRWPLYLYETRRILLHHHPYSIVYLAGEQKIQVIAVAHSSRKPGYWKRRVYQ